MIQAYEHKATSWKQCYLLLVKQGKLSVSQQNFIDGQLQELLLLRLQTYNRKRSSSMPLKQFKQLRKGMFFTLDHALPDTLQESFFLQTSIEEQLRIGEARIEEIMDAITSLWLSCKKYSLPFYNERYLSILNEQIPKFLHAYDATYFPHQCLQDLDYPLWDGLAMDHAMYDKKGCDVVMEYLTRFFLEQQYAQLFQEELEEIIHAYETIHDVSITYVGVNLTNILLPLHVCSMCLPQTTIILSKDAFDYVKEHVSKYNNQDWSSMKNRIKNKLSHVLYQYLEVAITNTIDQIKRALHEGWLETLLLQEEANQRQDFLIQNNSSIINFDELLDEINAQVLVEDKIRILRSTPLSIHDQIDLFENDIFFEREFATYYRQCEPLELAVLLYLCKPEEFIFHNYPNKESLKKWKGDMTWQSSLYAFLLSQNDTYWSALTIIFTTIKFRNEG